MAVLLTTSWLSTSRSSLRCYHEECSWGLHGEVRAQLGIGNWHNCLDVFGRGHSDGACSFGSCLHLPVLKSVSLLQKEVMLSVARTYPNLYTRVYLHS